MGDILKSRRIENFLSIVEHIKDVCFSSEFLKEMGEPIVYNPNQEWVFLYKDNIWTSFICYSGDKILYLYTKKEFRRQGLLKVIYNELPKKKWLVVASNMSYDFFIKRGFSVVKNYKNCHKLKLNDSSN